MSEQIPDAAALLAETITQAQLDLLDLPFCPANLAIGTRYLHDPVFHAAVYIARQSRGRPRKQGAET